MNKAWMMVIVAACFEVSWVIGMKHAQTPLEWIGTLIAIFVSFYLMIAAGKTIPVGTVYAVFVGLGTAGTVVAEMLIFNAEMKPAKLALLALLLVGVIILKMQTNDQENPKPLAVTPSEIDSEQQQQNKHEAQQQTDKGDN